jgi:hypothetical protein
MPMITTANIKDYLNNEELVTARKHDSPESVPSYDTIGFEQRDIIGRSLGGAAYLPTGEGINKSFGGAAYLPTGEGIVEDGARSVAKTAIRAAPIVGQLIPESWIDIACDWIGDNIWSPVKKFFGGGNLTTEGRKDLKRIRRLAKKLLKHDVQRGKGVTASFIKDLMNCNSPRLNTIAKSIINNISKPKIVKFIQSLPAET